MDYITKKSTIDISSWCSTRASSVRVWVRVYNPMPCAMSVPPLSIFSTYNCWQITRPVKPARAHAKVGRHEAESQTGNPWHLSPLFELSVRVRPLLLLQSSGKAFNSALSPLLCALPLLLLFEYLMRDLTLRYHALFLVLSSGLSGCSPPLTPACLRARDRHRFRQTAPSVSRPSFLLRHPHRLPVSVRFTYFIPWNKKQISPCFSKRLPR